MFEKHSNTPTHIPSGSSMPHRARLGGFKILSEVVRISLASPDKADYLPAECCRLLTGKKINLNFLSSLDQGPNWGLDLLVSAQDAAKAAHLLTTANPGSPPVAEPSALLSIFPHMNDPAILGELLTALSQAGIRPKSLSNSPSTLSVVLDVENVDKATESLFNPFRFSAYRTPSDWKLAQKGKEQIFKEVIASFEEKRPKVYFLEYQEERELLQLNVSMEHLPALGAFFRRLGELGVGLGFLATGVSANPGSLVALLLLPKSIASESLRILARLLPDAETRMRGAVAGFSMNGPHFGDRYGLAGELLNACKKSGVRLLGLACSIASISGVIPADHLQPAIETITSCFEVPSVIKKS
ncbi:MAG: hypothetical protein JRJ60_01510 [Deltaproteobacteria bacterium]|nr:hypothetical protein [Deltaproteobacteria bacterium]